MRGSHGPSSLAARIVDDAINDLKSAPKDSAAYRTACMFVDGGECSHLVCDECFDPKIDWRESECPPADGTIPCECGHGWDKHIVMYFEWNEHRDMIAGACGINPDTLRKKR